MANREDGEMKQSAKEKNERIEMSEAIEEREMKIVYDIKCEVLELKHIQAPGAVLINMNQTQSI